MTRKRNRSHVEPDESPPKKDSTAVLSSAKKRKLNTYGSSPTSETKMGTLQRKIGGLFSRGKEKENAMGNEDEDTDELAGDENQEEEPTTVEQNETLGGKKKKPTVDIFDIPDEEETDARGSVWKGTNRMQRARANLAPVGQDDGTGIPSPRRRNPLKAQMLKEDKKLSKKAARERLMVTQEEMVDGEENSVGTPTKRRQSKGQVDDRVAQSGGASSGRKRGRPKQVPIDTVDSVTQVPRGILTPTTSRTLTSRKSVVFQEGSDVDLGFKDLPITTIAKKLTGTSNLGKVRGQKPANANILRISDSEESEILDDREKQVAELVDLPGSGDESDEEEETVCAVCSGLDSKKKNPIIICESCESGIHLACSKLSKVPKEDWYCSDCRHAVDDDVLLNRSEETTSTESSKMLPSIEGLEIHLKCLQRVVLDKLTGRNRIKLRGHDDEMQKVQQVVEQTVLAGEGNSMLVIGARGCGKTTVCRLRYLWRSHTHHCSL